MGEGRLEQARAQNLKVGPTWPVRKIRVKTGHFDQILCWQGRASRHRLGL